MKRLTTINMTTSNGFNDYIDASDIEDINDDFETIGEGEESSSNQTRNTRGKDIEWEEYHVFNGPLE